MGDSTRRDARSAVLDAALVHAALWHGAAAVEAWRGRPADFQLDEIWNPGRHRLLGQIGINLAAAGCDESDVPRMSGIARKQWVEHQLAAARLRPVLIALGDAGVDAWLLGGGAIGRAVWGYDGQLGARSADDTRMLVRPRDALEAVRVLSAAGVRFPSPERCRRRVEWLTSIPMQLEDDSWSELSWSASPYVPASIEIEDASGSVDLGGIAARLPTPELVLVQVCADGAWSTRYGGLGWLLDVDRLVTQGVCDPHRASRLASSAGLGDLVDRRLALYRAAKERGGRTDWLTDCPVSSTGYQRLRADVRAFGRGRPPLKRLAGAGEFLADRWFLDSARRVPAAAARRAWFRARRLGRRGE